MRTRRPSTATTITSMARCSLLVVLSLARCNGYTTLPTTRSVSSTPQIKLQSEFAPCTIFASAKRSKARALKPGSGRTNLSMHMGHSHSHNHHHSHSHDHSNKRAKRKVPKGWRGMFSRPTVRIVFATLITLLPPIIKQRAFRLTRTDIGAFLLTSGVLSIFDSIRDETKALLDKGESWRLSMLKHSTPLSADYFFKNDNAADRVTFLGVIVNLLLSAGKFGVGVACHSSALIADAGHSLSDLFSDFVTLWAVQVARLPPDDDHPYGHGKFESVGSLFLSLTLLGTGLSVGLSSYIKFLTVVSTQRTLGVAAAAKLVEVPTWPALVMALLSILSKEWLYRITRRVGENLNSQVVIANAWHHRSDAYSSVLALVSIGLAMTVPSFLASDSAAGILVAGMIALTGAEILGESIRQLTDAVIDEDMVEQIKIKSAEDADVLKVTKARARQVGSSALVDIEVEVPAQLSSSAMRAIEERIRVRIKSEVDGNILGVEVKAVAQDEVFCPLLTAVVESDSDLNTSAIEIEEQARGRLDSHPGVLSANKVTIHYVDTVMVRVDANICMDRSINTLKEANELAVILRDELLDSDKCIVEANIFLDLNEMSGQEKVKVLQP